MIGNKVGHLLKCVNLYGNSINISETLHMLRRNFAPSLLKISCTNLYSIKCDKTSMNVFALSQPENFSWCLTYFDQFIPRIL